VSRPLELQRPHVLDLAGRCAALLGAPAPDEAGLTVVDAIGDGFGQVTEADRRNVLLAFQTQGILFDATYGAKAVTAMLDLVGTGERAPIVLWQTGGIPSALKLLTGEAAA
jgi:1-aminocyclopropane-1-carboxylate deaminase/D-cysteine desulfhydrase-like pyridoxal-dependent ACC family enzyme